MCGTLIEVNEGLWLLYDSLKGALVPVFTKSVFDSDMFELTRIGVEECEIGIFSVEIAEYPDNIDVLLKSTPEKLWEYGIVVLVALNGLEDDVDITDDLDLGTISEEELGGLEDTSVLDVTALDGI